MYFSGSVAQKVQTVIYKVIGGSQPSQMSFCWTFSFKLSHTDEHSKLPLGSRYENK